MSTSEASTRPVRLTCPVCSSNVYDGDCLGCGCPHHVVAHESAGAWAADWLTDRETQAKVRRNLERRGEEIRGEVVRALKAQGAWLTDAEVAELMDDDAAVREYFARVKARLAGGEEA